MGKITFILGGARSGKSSYALKLAKAGRGKRIAFIATCKPSDNEMKKRIALHKKARPAHWQTFEEPADISLLLKRIGAEFDVIIIDCLTLLLAEFMLKRLKKNEIENKISGLSAALKKIKARSIVVSNEVGLGIVPENKLARDFRDIAGRMNQLVAGRADNVFVLISGIPWRIK